MNAVRSSHPSPTRVRRTGPARVLPPRPAPAPYPTVPTHIPRPARTGTSERDLACGPWHPKDRTGTVMTARRYARHRSPAVARQVTVMASAGGWQQRVRVQQVACSHQARATRGWGLSGCGPSGADRRSSRRVIACSVCAAADASDGRVLVERLRVIENNLLPLVLVAAGRSGAAWGRCGTQRSGHPAPGADDARGGP